MKYAAYHLSDVGQHFEENKTSENYLAFAAWIVTGKMPNLAYLMDKEAEQKRMKELDEIYAKGEKPELADYGRIGKKPTIVKSPKRTRKVHLTNIETGEEKEFEAIKDAAEYLAPIWNMKVNSIETSLRMKREYKGYKIQIEGKLRRKYKIEPIMAINIKPGEKHKFDCLVDCTRYITNLYDVIVCCGAIKEKAKTGKTYKDTWRFEYIAEMGDINAK